MKAAEVKSIARRAGFELAGIAAAAPPPEAAPYREWVSRGMAGKMGYLTDHRAELRSDPRSLLPSARSVLSVGKLYNTPIASTSSFDSYELAWISRYAWGEDYHRVLRRGLELVVAEMQQSVAFEHKICVDTAPILERAFAYRAGLGWIGKNTCLINQHQGSWFFLGELLLSLDLEPDSVPPDRCGTCTRCIDACPTQALSPFVLDSRLCISYLTIELHSEIDPALRSGIGNHVFGCDICQDVCPWNRRAPVVELPSGAMVAPPLEQLAALSGEEFSSLFGHTPVVRARYLRFLRNVAVAMGNSGNKALIPALEKLAAMPDALVKEHAIRALERLS